MCSTKIIRHAKIMSPCMFSKAMFTHPARYMDRQICSFSLNTTKLVHPIIYPKVKWYSTHNGEKPNLMDFPVTLWPNIFKSLQNWFLCKFIISRYFDKDFSMQEFIKGSKKAVEIVSHHISRGDLRKLNGLVTPEAIVELRQNLYGFSLRQQSEVAIKESDIFMCFPSEVGVMFDESDETIPQKRYVEITMTYHVLSGFKELRDDGEIPATNFDLVPEVQNRIFIASYRFTRNFTEGVKPNWIINGFNHYKPTHYR